MKSLKQLFKAIDVVKDVISLIIGVLFLGGLVFTTVHKYLVKKLDRVH